jgi:hypothetical protein
MGAVVAVSVDKSPSLGIGTTTTTAGSGHHHTTTTTSGAGGIPLAALKAACVANVASVLTAAQAYGVEHLGAMPPAGTAWAIAGASALLQSWPTSAYYSIAWNGHTVVVRAMHGRVSIGSAGTATPPTGCDAL